MKKLFILIALIGSFIYADGLGFDKKSTCLVRQLSIYKAPRWAAKIEVANGKIEYFCSPKSMFEFYHRPGKWFDVGVKKEEDFEKILVTDYKTFKPINARKAYFVYGSRITSPAGDDLVPFKLEADAKNFAKENNGKRVLRFSEVKDSLIRLLNGRI